MVTILYQECVSNLLLKHDKRCLKIIALDIATDLSQMDIFWFSICLIIMGIIADEFNELIGYAADKECARKRRRNYYPIF